MSDKKPIAYRLEPVYQPAPGQLSTAAVMQCALTGKFLSGSGGGGMYLAPEIVDEIRRGSMRYDPDPKPAVHHLGAALQTIADEHADVLTPRQTNALYKASRKLWDDT